MIQPSGQPTPQLFRALNPIFRTLWPSMVLSLILAALSTQPIIWVDPDGGATEGSLLHIRATELLLVAGAGLSFTGSSRIRVMARSFLFTAAPILVILQFTDFRRDYQFDAHSLPTQIIKWLAQGVSLGWNLAGLAFFRIIPNSDYNVDYYYGAMSYISAWWLGCFAACSQDLYTTLGRHDATSGSALRSPGRWNVSLKAFLILVSLTAWTFGVLQMPLWRQRYAAIAMLVIGTLIAALGCWARRDAARQACRAWLLVAGVHLGFLMLVREDGIPYYAYADSAASTACMEMASVPLLDEEMPWDWWKDYDGEEIDALWNAKSRGYIITWSSLLCVWLATMTSLICYRRASLECAGNAGLGGRYRVGAAFMGLGMLIGLTAIAFCLTAEQAAHFAMKLTEVATLAMLLIAFVAQGRWRRFAARFLTVALAFLFIEQFATFYRLEHAFGDSPFLRLYTWLWNWRHGEPYPPYEHERHLLLSELTYRHVDYLLACECITSWWLGAIAAFSGDWLDAGKNVDEPCVAAALGWRYWTPGRRVSLLAVTLASVAGGIFLCYHPSASYYSLSMLEAATIVVALMGGISVAAGSMRARRWVVGLGVYLFITIVAFAHDRKWCYWDFGLTTSGFDLLYLHLFEGRPLAFWKIVPPEDALLINPAAKQFSTVFIAVFGVWFASVAAICWRPDIAECRELRD